MKRGLIVYLTGGAELPEGFDLLRHCREIGFTADRRSWRAPGKDFLK